MTKQNLLELADRVEAGEAVRKNLAPHTATHHMVPTEFAHKITNAILKPNEYGLVCDACEGSLDAAKALHDAVLPGWYWDISVEYGGGGGGNSSSAKVMRPDLRVSEWGGAGVNNPAAAWVAAVLRAKASEADDV